MTSKLGDKKVSTPPNGNAFQTGFITQRYLLRFGASLDPFFCLTFPKTKMEAEHLYPIGEETALGNPQFQVTC